MKKLRIGICDDEKTIVKLLESIVKECLVRKDIDADIKTFETGEELIEFVSEIDAVFLDIQMPGIDGIDTAKIIKQLNNSCKIIFSTSSDGYYKEGFIIDIFRYITKPFALSEIEEALESLQELDDVRVGMDEIELYENRRLLKVEQNAIQYIVSYDSYAEFVLQNRVLRKNISLKELEDILDQRIFFRVHKKYIVNMLLIETYKEEVITINNGEIKVARRKKKEFEQAYMECDISYR